MFSLVGAMVTPFDEDGQIDYRCVEKLLVELEKTGHDSVVVAGTTGEEFSLSKKEKMELLRFVKKHTKLKVWLGIQENSTQKAEEEVRFFLNEKPDVFLVGSPSYILPTQDGLFLHFKHIALAAEQTPIVLYNVPKRTGVSLSFSTIRRLLAIRKNIIGIKECSADKNLFRMLKENYPNFQVWLGSDEKLFDCFPYVDGMVSVMSILFGTLMKKWVEGNGEDKILKDYLSMIAQILSSTTNPIPIKYALEKKGFESMNLRLPLTRLDYDQQQKVDLLFSCF